MVNRREFLDALAVGAAGLAIRANAQSYGQILGSNSRLNFAVIGLNSRGYAHLSALKANEKTACITHVCDVDSNILNKFAAKTLQAMGSAPTAEKDFRPEGRGRDHHCHSRPLAYSDGHRRVAGGQACVRRKALQPQPRRRSSA